MQHIDLRLCRTPQDAIKAGFVYREPEYKKAEITSAVVVGVGTVGGNPTVDLIFTGPDGQKYVALITANLLASIQTAAFR